MIWFLVAQTFSTLISLIQIGRKTESDKDLEIMVLRYQLGIAERKMKNPVRANRVERMALAVLAGRLKKQTNRPANQFTHLIRLVQPETAFRWHRDLVRRKWTQESQGKRGRPRIDDQIEHLIVRLAKENLRWGYYKIEGELTKLGFDVSLTTVRNVLGRNDIVPAPVRYGSIGWRVTFLWWNRFSCAPTMYSSAWRLEPDGSIWLASRPIRMGSGWLNKLDNTSGLSKNEKRHSVA